MNITFIERSEKPMDEDERAEAVSAAGAKVVEGLKELYRLFDGDGIAVGECVFECDKAARRLWQEEER
jgi:hypothetical protein